LFNPTGARPKESIITVVVRVASSILSKGLRHREFQDLLNSFETKFGDGYCFEVRRLSGVKMLKRVFDLKEGIQMFVAGTLRIFTALTMMNSCVNSPL
jgi:hypothetical protein